MFISVDDTFLQDPEDDLLYGPPAGMGEALAEKRKAILARIRALREAAPRDGSQVAAELKKLAASSGMGDRAASRARWEFAPTDRPRWKYGTEAGGPRDWRLGADFVPRWVGLQKPGTNPAYPKNDPAPWMPGDAFGMGQVDQIQRVPEPPGLLKTALAAAAQEVVFKSQISPPVGVRPFAQPGEQPQVQGGGILSSTILPFVKPAVYLRTPVGLVPLFEPYGPPTRDYSGPIAFGLGVALAGGAWLSYKVVKKLLS